MTISVRFLLPGLELEELSGKELIFAIQKEKERKRTERTRLHSEASFRLGSQRSLPPPLPWPRGTHDRRHICAVPYPSSVAVGAAAPVVGGREAMHAPRDEQSAPEPPSLHFLHLSSALYCSIAAAAAAALARAFLFAALALSISLSISMPMPALSHPSRRRPLFPLRIASPACLRMRMRMRFF
jgi:hypothetical protein